MTDVTIRTATPDDTPLIFSFIMALAEYEELASEVQSDEAHIHETLFGDTPQAEVIFAEIDGEAVGFALFFHNYSTFMGKRGLYLEDLFVQPEARGLGAGKKMLQYLARLAVERKCGRFEWWVLDWNKPAIDFYKSLGAIPMNEFTVYRLDGKALKNLASTED